MRPTTALVALALTLGITGCGRWMDNTPVRMQGQARNPHVIYHQLIQRAVALGYHVQADPARCSFRVLARLDQGRRFNPRRASWFNVTVYRNGMVDVVAYGAHVRDGGAVIHRKLCSEYTAFLDNMTYALGAPPRVVAYAAR